MAFHREGEEAIARTHEQPCRTSASNVYVAGMRAGEDYRLRSELVTGGAVKPGEWMPFRTALVDGDFPPVSAQPIARASRGPVAEPFLIHSAIALTGLEGSHLQRTWTVRSSGTSLLHNC